MKRIKRLIVSVLIAALALTSLTVGTPAFAAAPGGAQEVQRKEASPLFRAQFEGDKVAGSGEVVNGAYRVAAEKTDGEAWHVKLESNYPTVPGHEYHVTYRFHSDTAGLVKFGDFQEFQVVKGDNEVTGLVIAKDGTSYLDLQLGALGPFTMDFSEIEVVEIQDEVKYEDALPEPLRLDAEDVIIERHDQGYSPDFVRTPDAVTVNYYSTGWDTAVWKARLYINTGFIPRPGTRYRVSADVLCEKDMDYELLLNKGEREKGYGALYGRHLTGGEVSTVETVLNFPAAAFLDEELVLQFSIGNAPEGTDVTISNVRVEKVIDSYSSRLPAGFALDKVVNTGRTLTTLVPTNYTALALPKLSYNGTETVRERHDGDYEASLEKAADSATYKITRAPESGRGVWKAQLFVDTGAVLEAGKSYRIALDVKGSADQAKYEACFDGDSENVYGAFYSRSLTAGVVDHVERLFTADASHGPLTIRLQFGETNTTAGNNITVSNVSVEEITPAAGDPLAAQSYVTGGETLSDELLPLTFAYPTTTGGSTQHVDDAWVNQTVTLNPQVVAWDGSAATAGVDNGSATFQITTAQTGGGIWSTRLHLGTGVTLENGEKYSVSATFSSDKAIDEFQLLYSNGFDENDGFNPGGKGYHDGKYGLSVAENGSVTLTQEITVPERTTYNELVLRFQLGLAPVDSNITVSNISISKFVAAHDEVVDPVTVPNAFVLEPRNGNEVSEAVLTGNGSSATAKVTVPSPTGVDDWHIKLLANTGVELTEGKQYQITMKINSTDSNYSVCYRRDAEGDHDYDFNADPGINSSDKLEFLEGGLVRNTVTARYTGALQILLKLGKFAADGTITVSDISIKEVTPSSGSPAFTANGDVGYDRSLSNTATSATMKVSSAPDSGAEVWKHKLFADTGVTLQPYKFYRVSADVSASNAFDYEICYNRDGEEKGFGAKYGLQAGSTAQTVVFDTQATAAGKLILQFAVGKAPVGTDIVISNIKVQELTAPVGASLIPGFRCDSAGSFSVAADAGYVTSLEKAASSATLKLDSAPAVDRNLWNLKLNVKTGFTPENGKAYRVSFDINAARAQDNVEVFYDGSTENAYGQLFSQSLPAGARNISYMIMPGQPKGELSLQIRLGRTNDADSNSYTVSNVKLEEVAFVINSKPETKETTELWTHNGYDVELKRTATTAAVNFKSVPAQGREPWKTKLFIETGVTLLAGQKYRISLDAFSNADIPFELCFNDGGEEKGVGAIYGLTATADAQTIEYIVYSPKDAHLVIQISLGNASAHSNFNVANVKVEKAGATSEVSDTVYAF